MYKRLSEEVRAIREKKEVLQILRAECREEISEESPESEGQSIPSLDVLGGSCPYCGCYMMHLSAGFSHGQVCLVCGHATAAFLVGW